MLDASDGLSLIGANIQLVGTTIGAAADSDGRFEINNVAAGTYSFDVSMLGFERMRIDNVQVGNNSTSDYIVQLSESPLLLSEVVVTPGYFQLMHNSPVVRHTLTQEEIRRMPHIADDAFRAVSRLPGLATSDFSAGFYVQGGTHEEVLILLDGLELIEPFHIKNDYGGGSPKHYRYRDHRWN